MRIVHIDPLGCTATYDIGASVAPGRQAAGSNMGAHENLHVGAAMQLGLSCGADRSMCIVDHCDVTLFCSHSLGLVEAEMHLACSNKQFMFACLVVGLS